MELAKSLSAVTLSDFRHSRSTIQPHIRTTPIVPSDLPNVFLKLETLQHAHSVTARGAFALIHELIRKKDHRTIVTPSAGNDGIAVAHAASTLQFPCVIVVPSSMPAAKIDMIRRWSVDLRVEGQTYQDAERLALDIAADGTRYIFSSPHLDVNFIIGQGTLAFEILEQMPDTETFLLPLACSGLAAGVGTAVKALGRRIRVIGVYNEASAGRPNFSNDFVDDIIAVSPDGTRAAAHQLLLQEKLVVEEVSAVTIAAIVAGKIRTDAPTVAILSDGNTNVESLGVRLDLTPRFKV